MNRKKVIEKAKEDVRKFIILQHPDRKGTLRFVIKRKEKKVIGYIQGNYVGDFNLHFKASAKCHKEDTFNEHIGKAIVAYRVFGLPVPECYLQDYKKGKVENGNVIVTKEGTYMVVADNGLRVHSEAFKDFKYCKGRTSPKYANGIVVDDTGYIDVLVSSDSIPTTPPTLGCYDRQKHECDGSCQGCSECIMAVYYRGETETKPTKKEMRYYIKGIKRSSREINKILKEPEFKNEIKKLVKELF